jgi:hypothetical protein
VFPEESADSRLRFDRQRHRKEPVLAATGSRVRDVSELHPEKQDSQITSTDEGMRIDVKPLCEKAERSNRDIFVPESNVTDASNLHS